jgi:hypothetical protein
LVNDEVNEYLKTGVITPYELFKNKVKNETSKYVELAQETAQKQINKNSEEFQMQMEKMGIEKKANSI